MYQTGTIPVMQQQLVLKVLGSLGVISQLLKSKHVMESATLAAMMELLQGQVSVKFLAS